MNDIEHQNRRTEKQMLFFQGNHFSETKPLNRMKRYLVDMVFVLTIFLLYVCVVPANASTGDVREKNAIFNGLFFEGITSWGKLGPGHPGSRMTLDRTQVVDIIITNMLVTSPEMQRTFTIYNTILLKVRQNLEYEIVLEAFGKGHLKFGVCEYNKEGRHIGNKYSEQYVLTSEAKEYRYVYKPSANATGIRPAILFLPMPDGKPMDLKVRISKMQIPVNEDVFKEMTVNWPDYAKEERFADYNGFSKTDIKEMEKIADVDILLPPYKPIKMNKPGDFTLTTSRMHFGEGILPNSISVLGRDILAGAIELLVELEDGTKLNLHPISKTSVSLTDMKAILQQKFASNDVEMVAKLEMEYDALMIYTLSFSKNPRMSIAQASLSITFQTDIARYIRYNRFSEASAGYGDRIFGYGPIPARGERIETKAVIGSKHIGRYLANDWHPKVPGDDGFIWVWSDGFLHSLWIGDEDRGLSFMCLSQEGYNSLKGNTTVRLARNMKGIKLTYNFITNKAVLNDERKLQFALQVMPPKPPRDNSFFLRGNNIFAANANLVDRTLTILEEKLRNGIYEKNASLPVYVNGSDIMSGVLPQAWEPRRHRKYRDFGTAQWPVWSEGCNTPLVKYQERLAKMEKYSDILGHLNMPYFAATHISSQDPAGHYYLYDWTCIPQTPRPQYLRSVCPESMFSAYIAHGIGKLIDKYSIKGVYFDNCDPILCQNIAHGCGYVDEKGERRSTLPLLGFRKLLMMVRHEFIKRGVEPFIMTHAGLHPGIVSFSDVEFNGEGIYGSDHTEMFTLGEWRARWLGANQFGVQMLYFPQFGYGIGSNVDRTKQAIVGTPTLLAMSLIHGTHVRASNVDNQILYRVWKVMDELDEPGIEFIPYWKWDSINIPLNQYKVYASAYSGKDRLLLVLSNLSDVKQEVAFPLSIIKARNSAAMRVSDNMHGLPVSIEGGSVKCTVPGKNFRLLSFTR